MITIKQILDYAASMIPSGASNAVHKHNEVLNIYNGHKPLARNYKVQFKDHWCATFISSLFIHFNAVNLIGGTECSCGNLITIMQKKGIWIEGHKSTPLPGDIIFYDWDAKGGWPEHVGIVEKVFGGTAIVIEGNYNNTIKRRTINTNWSMIRGYGRPKYSTKSEPDKVLKSIDCIAKEVLQGAWGVGPDRIRSLTQAGYDAKAVQEKVNDLITSNTNTDKDIEKTANEVIEGLWGDGAHRINALKRAGYDPKAVQKKVNEICSKRR